MQKVKTKEGAERVLTDFPEKILNEIVLAVNISKKALGEYVDHMTLPSDWYCALYGNCLTLRYKDGEQEEERFYVPCIDIYFEPELDVKRSIMERYPLGFCSCGKAVPVLQHILRVSKGLESKNIFVWLLANVDAFILWCRLRIFPVHQYSILYNKHPKCL